MDFFMFSSCAPFHDVSHVFCLSSVLHGLTALLVHDPLCAEIKFPPLHPKAPFSTALYRTPPLLFLLPHYSTHLYSAPASLFHDFWPLTMAYKSRFSFWEQKGSLMLFSVFFWLSLHTCMTFFCWICGIFSRDDGETLVWTLGLIPLCCCFLLCRLKLRTSQM